MLGGLVMADGNLLREVESGAFWRAAFWLGAGVAIYFTLSNTIATAINPLLAQLKLSATPT